MKLAITAATGLELKEASTLIQEENRHEIIFCITGVGLLSAAFALTKIIFEEKPDLILQIGIAGTFHEEMKLSDIVVVKEEVLADMGVMEDGKWKDIFDLNLAAPDEPPFENKLLTNPWLSKFNLLHLPEVTDVSVNCITTEDKEIRRLKEKYDPVTESMEGAALHYVCTKMNIPFLQIRAISNYVGERDKSKWEIKKAVDNLATTIINYIGKLQKKLSSD